MSDLTPSQETAYSTYGIDSPALQFLFEKLTEEKARRQFFKILQSAKSEFQYAQTLLALELLRNHFLARIEDSAPFASHQKNVLTALYREEREALIEDGVMDE